ncbi:P-loop containing nucleoside triphosphate hydrolase protein [Xylariaceae sp. FL0255]|nr:P-loop containing nucleoside triphosphate hydrolase protein [Xylariaceae sp. FL0255]
MPSAVAAKRSRHAAFAHGESDDDAVVESAMSNLRNDTTRKKPRLSSSRKQPRPASPLEDDDNDDDHHDGNDDNQTPPPATQYERMRDQDFSHLEHAEADDQRATQRLRDRPTIVGDNHIALNAIIESITCVNFMCHVRLHVELGPLLNFIVGENGSGKSAVLTAITLCLGGKASATNRGGSLRAFVKEGQEHANLIVKLKNQGDDAYKADVFGDFIVCERWFTKSGTSGFKLKSASGRVISNKKADVEDIVEWYCLQVDNPLNVLSQDNARQFLNAASSTMKYAYFMKGTQLEQLNDDYQQLMQAIDDNESKVAELEENAAYLRTRREEAVKLRDSATRSREMRRTARVYYNQMAWAQVQEQEAELQMREHAILKAQESIDLAQTEIDQHQHKLDQFDRKIDEAKLAANADGQEQAQAQGEEEEAKNLFDTTKTELATLQANEREAHTQLTNASKNTRHFKKEIENEETRLAEKNGGKLAQKQRELDEAKQAEERMKMQISEHKDALHALLTHKEAAQTGKSEPERLLQQKKREVHDAEQRLRTCQQNRTNPRNGFDPSIHRLIERIEKDNGFLEKPIGPLGLYIQLTKPEWMSIFETVLSSPLGAFIVKNKQDHNRLRKHMDELNIPSHLKIPIYIGNPSLGALREPEPKFDTMLRVLKFDDQTVRDHLIIQARIDQVLLVEQRVEAEEIMTAARPPTNTSFCLTFHDTKKGHGLRIKTGDGGMSTSPVTPILSLKPRMKTDDDQQLDYWKSLVAQLKSELHELQRECEVAEQELARAARAIIAHNKQTKSLEAQALRLEAARHAIEDELEIFNGAGDRLQGLKEELSEAQERQDRFGNQYGELALKKGEMNSKMEKLKDDLTQAKALHRDRTAQANKSQDKVKRLQDVRHLTLTRKNEAHEKSAVAKVTKEEAEASRDRQIQRLAQFTETAKQVCPERVHVPENETQQSLTRKVDQIKDDLARLERELGGTEEALSDRAATAVQMHKEASDNLKNVKIGVDIMKQSLMDRLAKYRQFIRHVSAQARCNFSYLLSERGFRGQLLLDHVQKRLEVQVEPDKAQESGKGRNTKTLSGGEKSFSSICLLLAIWDAMGSPLRCLDEFDVFMDNVNRAISTNMLIAAARRSVGKQFILITPNAIEGRASLDKDVKIIRQVSVTPHLESFSLISHQAHRSSTTTTAGHDTMIDPHATHCIVDRHLLFFLFPNIGGRTGVLVSGGAMERHLGIAGFSKWRAAIQIILLEESKENGDLKEFKGPD